MLKFERIWPKPSAMRMASAEEMQDVLAVVFENLDDLPVKGWAAQRAMRGEMAVAMEVRMVTVDYRQIGVMEGLGLFD